MVIFKSIITGVGKNINLSIQVLKLNSVRIHIFFQKPTNYFFQPIVQVSGLSAAVFMQGCGDGSTNANLQDQNSDSVPQPVAENNNFYLRILLKYNYAFFNNFVMSN